MVLHPATALADARDMGRLLQVRVCAGRVSGVCGGGCTEQSV